MVEVKLSPSLGKLGELSKLILRNNHIFGSIPSEFGSCSKLQLLDLSSKELSEYGCMVRIREKSDVYSLGVVLLEIITGKRPVDASFGEEEGEHVIGWVRQKLKSKKETLEIVDSKLRGLPDTEIQEMLQALGIALLCTSQRPEDRPTMKDVAALLTQIHHDPSLSDQPHKPPTFLSPKTTPHPSSF